MPKTGAILAKRGNGLYLIANIELIKNIISKIID
jgi:hypothetical protein